MSYSGVFPCWKNMFKVGTKGPTSIAADMKSIADMESFSVSIDGNIEEWKPFDAEGWTRRLMTGKALTVSASGKRNIGDAGNDFIAGLAFLTGADATVPIEWTFPDGAKLTFSAVINVTALNSGDSTSLGTLEFELQADGKPTYTAGI